MSSLSIDQPMCRRVALVVTLIFSGCLNTRTPSLDAPLRPTTALDVAGNANTTVEFATSPPSRFQVVLAVTEQEQAKGLMGVSSLPNSNGMLFVFSRPQTLSFWMKNTFIPLDLIFLDADKRVVTIVPNAEPGSLRVLTSKQPAQYVVEINGGLAERYGISVGTQATFLVRMPS